MSFISTLSWEELQTLRRIVKKTHLAYVPQDFATDRECDKMIEAIGPEIVERMIRFGKDQKVLEK